MLFIKLHPKNVFSEVPFPPPALLCSLGATNSATPTVKPIIDASNLGASHACFIHQWQRPRKAQLSRGARTLDNPTPNHADEDMLSRTHPLGASTGLIPCSVPPNQRQLAGHLPHVTAINSPSSRHWANAVSFRETLTRSSQPRVPGPLHEVTFCIVLCFHRLCNSPLLSPH